MTRTRTFVWGFTYDVSRIVDHLNEGDVCDVRVWIGTEKRATYSRRYFMMPDLSFRFDSPLRCPSHIYDQLYANFYEYIETIYHRKDAYYQHTLHDYLDYYHQLLDYFYYLFTEHQIELLLMENIPHYGADKILYDLAKAMGIKTVNLYHAMFADRFFYVYDIADCGYFNQLTQLNEYEPYKIDLKYNQYMDYVKNFKPYKYTLFNACKDIIKNQEWYAFSKFMRFRKFAKNHDQMVDRNIDFNQPYVYFPLHYQPELSTFPLANKFVDQVLALETLSEMIPEGWNIIIKENIMQGEYRRGNGFYARLQRLSKVKLAPRETSSHHLIQGAQFTATLTGTAGWESLCFGKNALVFGQPWYLKFPGVFQYKPSSKDLIESIMNFKIDQNQLEDAASLLMAKAGKGEICYWYSSPDFDKIKNARIVARSLERIIQYHPANREERVLAV